MSVLALVVFSATILAFNESNQLWHELVSMTKKANVNGVYVGTLGRATSDVENVLGSLALVPSPDEGQRANIKVSYIFIKNLTENDKLCSDSASTDGV